MDSLPQLGSPRQRQIARRRHRKDGYSVIFTDHLSGASAQSGQTSAYIDLGATKKGERLGDRFQAHRTPA